MTIVELSAKLIRVFEGCKLKAYWDKTGKVWTIGFGHTRGVKKGDSITFDQAVILLEQDIAQLISMVDDRPLIEAAALVSFGYNCGASALRRVLSGDIKIIDGAFVTKGQRYGESSEGVKLDGLVARRALEASLIEASRESS